MLKTAVRDSGLRNYLRRVPNDSVLYLPGLDFGNWHTDTIKDYSGNGNDGAIAGATTVVLPSGLGALSYDGLDDITLIDAGLNDDLTGAAGVTCIFWFKVITFPAGAGFEVGFELPDLAVNASIAFDFENPTPTRYNVRGRSQNSDGLQAVARNFTDTTKYHFLAFSLDFAGDTIKDYLDGTYNSTAKVFASAVWANDNTGHQLAIGARENNSLNSNIEIALFRIVTTVLTQAQLDDIYGRERQIFEV